MLNPPYPSGLIVGVALALTTLILLADVFAAPELNFGIFYLVPLTVATWYLSARFGALLAGTSVFVWLLADLMRETVHTYAFTPYWNAAARLGIFLAFTLLFARLRERLSQAERLATVDQLTQLTNSFAFHVLVDKEVQASRRAGKPITIVYVDLDDFKLVNDRWGHVTGDEVLRAVAETLQRGLRGSDVVARLGGDEFAIMLPDTGQEVAASILERLRVLLLEALKERNWPVTASFGAVTFMTPPTSVSDMLGRADELMYRVKSRGKNQIEHVVSESA